MVRNIRNHGITRQHIQSAMRYISKQNKRDDDGVFYIRGKARSRYIEHGQEKFAIRDVVKMAYLVSIGRISPNSSMVSGEDMKVANDFFRDRLLRNAPSLLNNSGFPVVNTFRRRK